MRRRITRARREEEADSSCLLKMLILRCTWTPVGRLPLVTFCKILLRTMLVPMAAITPSLFILALSTFFKVFSPITFFDLSFDDLWFASAFDLFLLCFFSDCFFELLVLRQSQTLRNLLAERTNLSALGKLIENGSETTSKKSISMNRHGMQYGSMLHLHFSLLYSSTSMQIAVYDRARRRPRTFMQSQLSPRQSVPLPLPSRIL